MISQIFLFIFGASAIYLVGRTDKWRRYGYIMGILGQPFWFYTTISSQQWGMLALCTFYLYSWVNGFYNHWLAKPKPTKPIYKLIYRSYHPYTQSEVIGFFDSEESGHEAMRDDLQVSRGAADYSLEPIEINKKGEVFLW